MLGAAASDEDGQVKLAPHLAVEREQGGGLELGVHVRVEVGDVDAKLAGAVDLGAQFGLGFLGLGAPRDLGRVERKIALGVEQAGTLSFESTGPQRNSAHSLFRAWWMPRSASGWALAKLAASRNHGQGTRMLAEVIQ